MSTIGTLSPTFPEFFLVMGSTTFGLSGTSAVAFATPFLIPS